MSERKALRPSIVIPGIQGSMLQNFYPIDPVTTWSTLTIAEAKFFALDFETLALTDDAQADRSALVVTRPAQLLDIAYATLAQGLQGRNQVPAYLFAYDWRYSNVRSAQELVHFVERLQAKSIPALPAWDRRFDFACHSMGGLVFRQFLQEWKRLKGSLPPVGRVAFVATPHKGSLGAAEALISGEGPMFGGRKEMRKLARTYPGVYELLPLFGNGVMKVIKGGLEIDLFQEKNWQKNTVEPDDNAGGFDIQQRHLTDAERVLRALPAPVDFGIADHDLLVIFGAKENSTLVRVEVSDDAEQNYDFDAAKKGAGMGAGDDVVPVQSAKLEGVTAAEIKVDDLSYVWHPIQRAMVNDDLHAFLPALDEVQTIIANFFNGQDGEDILPRNLRGQGRISVG
jgi:Lecithin:cholesterol acyltransferase